MVLKLIPSYFGELLSFSYFCNNYQQDITMKKFFLTLFIMVVSLTLTAQDYYEPFLVDGKVWYYETTRQLNQHVIGKYYIDGDTLIAGKNCKKLMFELPGTDPYLGGALYEEERRVWMFYPISPGKEPALHLLYDFSCKEGDVMKVDLVTYGEIVLKVDKIETVYTFTRPRRLFTLIDVSENNRHSGPAYWLEGVGSRRDMFSLWPPGGVFVSCEIDGNQVADQSSFGPAALMTDIQDISPDTSASNTIHDLQGRRLNGVPQKGIYIQNGRKYVR